MLASLDQHPGKIADYRHVQGVIPANSTTDRLLGVAIKFLCLVKFALSAPQSRDTS